MNHCNHSVFVLSVDVVSVRHITMAVNSITEVQQQQQDVGLNMEEVSQTLTRMFGSVGHVTVAAPEEICSLMFRLYDRSAFAETLYTGPQCVSVQSLTADMFLCFRNQTGRVSATSLQTALIALSTDNLLDKYRGDKPPEVLGFTHKYYKCFSLETESV